MADIKVKNINRKDIKDEELYVKTTELLYFAYRDFIAWPDEILQNYGFGRAHHRILFFVNQNPGMTVAELLDILNITKQSLSRVLSSLIEKGYIIQEIGQEDRRQRLLNLTDKGNDLLAEVSSHQKEQIIDASKASGVEAMEGFWKVLHALIDDNKVTDNIFKNK